VRGSERGVALLEVLIALALLSIAGLATVAMVDSAVRAESEMAKRENAVATASRVLTALTLLKASELTQRIGYHPLGEFIVSISRPEPALYRIALSEAGAATQEIVATVVYRP
jgi:prepilin-type N-terminal cleavage/methylation domain-containing protein